MGSTSQICVGQACRVGRSLPPRCPKLVSINRDRSLIGSNAHNSASDVQLEGNDTVQWNWPIDGYFNATASREFMLSGEEHTCATDVDGLAGARVIFRSDGSVINGKGQRKANSRSPLLRGWRSEVQAKTHTLRVEWER